MDEQTLLTSEERRDFREWEKGFESPFWKKLVGDMQKELEAAPDHLFWAVKTWEELVAARARLQAVAQLIAYPTIIAQKKENILSARAMQAEDEAEDEAVGNL